MEQPHNSNSKTVRLAPAISTQRRIFESIAVILVAAGKFVFMDWLQAPGPFIFGVSILTIIYIIARNKHVRGMAAYWGFRSDNFFSLSRRLAFPAIVVFMICVGIGYFRGTLIIHWHILPLFVVYPLWGTLQQYLCLALVAGNLQDGRSMNKTVIVLVTALLFGAMHLPNVSLAIGTFLLAVVYGALYLKERNLFVLGILHGWLGAVFYFTVVGQDQWSRVF